MNATCTPLPIQKGKSMADHPVSIVRIVEKYASMSENGVNVAEREVFTFRVSGDGSTVSQKAGELLNAWLKSNPGSAGTYSITRWYPRNDQ
jgi:hypothetical protein